MKKFDDINVIPFIDIMLVLLAITLATASFISQGKIEVTVPESQSQTKVTADDVVELISINDEGIIYYKDNPIELPELETVFSTMDKEQKITLKIDEKTPFQYFIQVTDIFRKFDLKKVTIMTKIKPVESAE